MTENQKKILLVDDEERLLNSMSQRISLLGFLPLKALSGLEAIEIAKTTHVDLAIVDLKMPDMEGLVTITKLKEIIPDLRTVLLTGYGSEKVKQATEALGSMYVEKDSMGGLWDIIKQSSNQGKVVVIKPPGAAPPGNKEEGISGRVEILPSRQYDRNDQHYVEQPAEIIGEDPQIQRLRKNIQRFAQMDSPILLKGEIGTGKELAARTIHHLSRRRHQRFLPFDCGCFSSDFHFSDLVTTLDAEGARDLFQPQGGQKNPVLFSGTIFLDHIENMPQQNQQEMMDLLEGKLTSDGLRMDIRFIVVADQKLQDKIASGGFLKDLFSRIRAIELAIPPLRQRKEDLFLLVNHFLEQANHTIGKNVTSLSNNALKVLKSYSFPGNIGELKQIIERAVMLTKDETITLVHLPERLRISPKRSVQIDSGTPFPTIQEMEKQHILKALEKTRGNKSYAAELLGISRAALWRKLRAYKDES